MYRPEIGMQVVCVEEFPPVSRDSVYPPHSVPYVKQVLTIRDIGECLAYDRNMSLFLRFEEIVNPTDWLMDGVLTEVSFCYTFFRPVRKTDISVFTEMLTKNKPPKNVSFEHSDHEIAI